MSNLRQGNIKLLVASWAPLRCYLVAQLKFQSPWASGQLLISVPEFIYIYKNNRLSYHHITIQRRQQRVKS